MPHFGPAVLEMVQACSDDEVPAGAEKRPWRIRKEEYLAHLDKLGAGHTGLSGRARILSAWLDQL